jgi:hypothetical protein
VAFGHLLPSGSCFQRKIEFGSRRPATHPNKSEVPQRGSSRIGFSLDLNDVETSLHCADGVHRSKDPTSDNHDSV